MSTNRSALEPKALMPENAQRAIGHGVRAKRFKSAAFNVGLLELERDRRPTVLKIKLKPRLC